MDYSTDSASLTFDDLNDDQQEAVFQWTGPMLVLAGAGSGKTRVLTHKIAFIAAQGVPTSQILAVTFTNKAAKQMQTRVEQLLSFDRNMLDSWVGTFHSMCGRILRQDIHKYRSASGHTWSNNFVIYDETDTVNVTKEAIRRLELDEKLYNPKTIRYQISGLKNQMLNAYQFASQATDFRGEKMARIYEAYEAIMSVNNALDFDDLLLKCVELFQQCPDVLIKYHERFTHILVDEFQDTNDVQYEWVRLLAEGVSKSHRDEIDPDTHWANRSLTVVGDVDQSIYSWRGANYKIILNFQQDFPQSKLVKLQHNYRSTANILSLANAVIENNEERLPKILIPIKDTGDKIHCYEAKDDRDEAHYILKQLGQRIDSGRVRPTDCCILYRTNAQSRVIEDVLISRGIPYTVYGGLKFYERREIKDVLAYLTLLFNDNDGYSVKRIINVPKRALGKTTLEKLETSANEKGMTLYNAMKTVDNNPNIPAKTQKTILGFVALIEELKLQAKTLPIDELMLAVIEKTGYIDSLRLDDPTDSEGRIQNVEEFVSVAKQYLIDNPQGDLAGFLTQMALLSDIDSAEPMENKLVLMTIHSAKGLEYPIVAICGLEDGLFPHGRSLNDKEQMEEERRLMYVAVTRAENELFLTFARKRLVFGELRYSSPSRFLKEAPYELLTGMYTLDTEESRYRDGMWTGSGSRYNRADDEGDSHDGDWDEAGRFIPKRSNNPYSKPSPSRDRYPSSKVPIPNSKAPTKKPTIGMSKPSSTPIEILKAGTRVRHQKFGTGTIEQVIGDGDKAIYSVQFDALQGKKLLDPKAAQLESI